MAKPLASSDFLELATLYAEYAAVVDAGDWERWTDLFADDCRYIVQPRENHERGLPLATLRLISNGMLKDRADGIRDTLFHDPYYQRHVVGIPRVLSVGENGTITAEANYAVFRTKLGELSTVFNVGRYLDTLVRTPDGLRFASRHCIYDSEMIPNAIIYPI